MSEPPCVLRMPLYPHQWNPVRNRGHLRSWGAHTKWKFKYGKERSPRGLECECTQEELLTSITKQLVFQYPFSMHRKSSLEARRALDRLLAWISQ
jgi:hypothetical protein